MTERDMFYKAAIGFILILLAIIIGSAVGSMIADSKEQAAPSPTRPVKIVKRIADVKRQMEICYMEGQRDAIEDDIRVTKVGSTWVYTKSPWDFDTSGYVPEVRIGNRPDRKYEYDYQGD